MNRPLRDLEPVPVVPARELVSKMLYKTTVLLALLDSATGFSALSAPAAPLTAAVARTSGVYATSSILRSSTPTCACERQHLNTVSDHFPERVYRI